MQRTILILTILIGILTAPSLCDAGVTAHDCHCEAVACCEDEGAACEPDPCDDVYNDTRQSSRSMDDLAIAIDLHEVDSRVVNAASRMTTEHIPLDDQPFPASDLPLRV